MKVAIITSGILPVPAVKGGAIETLLDKFVEMNEISQKLHLDIYSIDDSKINKSQLTHLYTHYLYINNIGNFLIKGINKIFKKNIPINLFYQKRVIQIINKKKYDYVIIENYPELALKIKNHNIIPYIHSDVFNVDLKDSQAVLDACDKVITVSDFIKNRILEINPTKKDNIYTVYNSIDFEHATKEQYEKYRNYYRQKYDIQKEDIVYVYSGRLSAEKGVLKLIKAFNQIEVPNKKLLIIGGIWYGSNKKNDYLLQLEKNSDETIIYTGYVSHSEIGNILCATDVGVVPSICNEAAGLSVVEFMNRGNIVVASNMGGIPEYLNCADNYLVEYCEDFINNLKDALENSAAKIQNTELTKMSNIQFSEKFKTSENYKQLIQVLESK